MNTKKILIAGSVIAAMSVSFVAMAGVSTTGNGAPSGSHYNLNIIGVPKNKTADMTGDNGHRIFVKLDGNTKIMLSEGSDFNVLDANGTDANGASFQLPNPDPDGNGITEYSVWARAVGKPGGEAVITTCATTVDTDEEVCSLESLTVKRERGKPTFENVSRELLYIYVDITDDDVSNPKLYSLFSEEMYGYFWSYDNVGLRVLQLRFYPISTNVNL